MDWPTVLTSAAVGAIVATLGQIVGQWLERRQRERELVFKFSVDAAAVRREHARQSGRPFLDRDPLYIAAEFYPLVQHLYRKGQLPDDAPPEVLPPTTPNKPTP